MDGTRLQFLLHSRPATCAPAPGAVPPGRCQHTWQTHLPRPLLLPTLLSLACAVRGLVEQILKYGRVVRPVLGITIAPPQVGARWQRFVWAGGAELHRPTCGVGWRELGRVL